MGIRLLILGASGQIGHALTTHAKPALGETVDAVIAYGRDKVDFNCPDQIVHALRDLRPDVIINAAAYTAVDKAEDEPELAMKVNADSLGVLAETAKKQDASLVHFSTDYVFDGTSSLPYSETSAVGPLNSYGRSKLAGEEFLEQVGGRWTCFRTSWVYAQRGGNFCKTMIRLAKNNTQLKVVDDQLGAPTPAGWLAELGLIVAGVVVQEKYRKSKKLAPSFLPDFPKEFPVAEIFHATARGQTTWYDYACFVIELAYKRGLITTMPEIQRSDSASMGFKAVRPSNSVLNTEKLTDVFRIYPPEWEKGVRNLVDSLEEV